MAAIKNCNTNGTAIQPGFDVRLCDDMEKPYVVVHMMNSEVSQGRFRWRVLAMGKSRGRLLTGNWKSGGS